jgi:REP element-mobilizing transposase RayT
MPREKRAQSKTGIYHTVIRGIDKRYIYEEDSDKYFFISCIKKAKVIGKFEIYAYCFMDNHAHLIIKEGNETIGQIMKRITVRYVQWYNKKYGLSGHLFQNRYSSETVETDRYLLAAIRYVHQNPIKAKIAKNLYNYQWSSYQDYINLNSNIIEICKILDYFAGITQFKKFMTARNQDECLDENIKTISDTDLKKEIGKIYPYTNFIHRLDKEKRNELIKAIKSSTNASNRRIGRVLGIGRGIVDKIK